MTIAAIVLNYRTAVQTVETVRSLQASPLSIAHVMVVDNASNDGSIERIRHELSGVAVFSPTHNRGFAAGCNIGIREALSCGAARLLLLNPDVVVASGALHELDNVMSGGGDVVGPVVVERRHPDRVESAGITYSAVTGRMRHRLSGATRSNARRDLIADVDAVSGCAMLIRREVFETVGLFAEEFFYGFEDLEFCLRAKAAGFRIACAGSAIVEHEGAASMGRSSARRLYFAVRNHLLLASRIGPQAWPMRSIRAANIVVLNVAHALFRATTPIAVGMPAVVRGVRDHLKGKYGSDEPPLG
jgi:GT2 family glycosyltransferase